MGTKTSQPTTPPTPEQQHEAAKAAFDAAVKKTAEQEGKTPAPVAAVAEKPAAEAKPAPKPKAAPKPKQPDPMDALRAEIAELKAKLDQPKPAPEEDEDPLEPFRAKLSQRFGDDEAEDLLELIEATNKPLREQVKQLQGILRDATNQGRANIAKANQKRLAAIHPQLKNSAAWDVLQASVLADFEKNPKAYESVEDAYDAKALALYGEPESDEETEEVDEEAPEDVEEAASRIAASAMTQPGRQKRESRTPEEKHRELHKYIVQHPDDKAGHRRLARELGIRP